MPTFIETLVYVVRSNSVLLIMKKKGLGAGYYNGVGGKVENGEDLLNAAIRECEEEIGVRPIGLRWMGLLEFWNYEDGAVESVHFVHVFTAEGYEGEPRESDEARPLWFNIDKVPYDQMWEDDKLWLPKILSGTMVYGRFKFNKWKLTDYQIYELKTTKT